MKLLLCLLLLTACASRKERPYIPFEERLKEISFDWNNDGRADRAALIPGTEEFLEFAVWLTGIGGTKKVVANSQFIETSSVPGARLELLPNGLIKIIEDHSGVGAAETIHEWTVAFIDDRFMLAGYAYEFHDQLDNQKEGECTLNLLDGSGVVNGSNVRFEPVNKEINDITVNFQPRPCKFKFNL